MGLKRKPQFEKPRGADFSSQTTTSTLSDGFDGFDGVNSVMDFPARKRKVVVSV